MNFWGASSTTHLEWVSIGMMGVFFLGPYIATYGRLLLWLYPLIIPTASPRKVNSIQSLDIYIYICTGWWFQTFFIFNNMWDNPSHWLIFFKIVKNHQPVYLYIYTPILSPLRFKTHESKRHGPPSIHYLNRFGDAGGHKVGDGDVLSLQMWGPQL